MLHVKKAAAIKVTLIPIYSKLRQMTQKHTLSPFTASHVSNLGLLKCFYLDCFLKGNILNWFWIIWMPLKICMVKSALIIPPLYRSVYVSTYGIFSHLQGLQCLFNLCKPNLFLVLKQTGFSQQGVE